MNAITVQEAQERLPELIAQACRGELIVLSAGDKQVALEPHVPLDHEEDTADFEIQFAW